MNNQTQSLGQRLKVAKERSEDEKIRIENQRKMREDKKIRQEYNVLVMFFENAKDTIIDAINDDKDNISISTLNHSRNYDWFHFSGSKLRLELDPVLNMAYDDFKKWLADNDLKVEPKGCHDGVGVKSWTAFAIMPKV